MMRSVGLIYEGGHKKFGIYENSYHTLLFYTQFILFIYVFHFNISNVFVIYLFIIIIIPLF